MDNRESRMITRRDPNGHFAVGVSGNPGGRPKGLASIIKDRTFDGQELVEFYTSVFRGEKIDGVKPSLKHRMEAGSWLSDRGFGKPAQQSVHEEAELGYDPHDLYRSYTPEQLQRMLDKLAEPGPLTIDGEARPADTPKT